MSRRTPLWLILFAALSNMIAPFSIDTYLPSFPAIEDYYHVSRELLSTSMGAYLLAFSLTTLIWGPLADRFGRQKISIISLAGFALASIGCALALSFDHFMVFRVLQGVFAGGVIIAARAMIRDFFTPQEAQKAMSLIMMVFAIAPAIAPIIGGYLQQQYDWQSIFWFLSAYGVFTLLIIGLLLKETQHPDHIQSIALKKLFNSYLHSLKHPLFIRLVLAQSFIFGGFFVYIAGSASLIFDHLKLGPEDFWVQFVPMVTGMILGALLSHRLSNKNAPNQIIYLSVSIGGFAALLNLMLLFITSPTILTIIPTISLYAFALSLGLPALSILAMDCLPEKRGMAASLQSLLQMGMAALVSIMLVPFVHSSLFAMAGSMFALWLMGALLWMTHYKAVNPKVL
ncbi:multidrug effflux MFS transporter [Thiomicrorhabdus arctica]|uniref:multidrug effflux MFS transporter n=1 Tax=Thiomicrorhabdus arctica TaxID=131540 RepID=UPI000360BF2F|nr:multidrug effflux MFS transporter [Thiomicrorhabdus arctica]